MDSDENHDMSNNGDALNAVNEDPFTFLHDFNENILPLQPPASVHLSTSASVGQPSSQATLPLSLGTGRYPGSVLGQEDERHAHSFSVSSRDPRIEFPGSQETPSHGSSGNILLGAQEPVHAFPPVNASSDGELGIDSVLVDNHNINENIRQSEGFASAPVNSGTFLTPDIVPRAGNDIVLNDQNSLLPQTGADVEGLTHSGGPAPSNAYLQGLHAAKVLQDMMQESAGSLPIASSQQAPLHGQDRQNELAVPTQRQLASDELKENTVYPIGCASTGNIVSQSLDQLPLHPNLPVLSDLNARRQTIPHSFSHNVGNIGMRGSPVAGPSHFLQSNSMSAITAPGSVNSKVLPDVVIDRSLLEKATKLEKGLHKSTEFELFCEVIRRKYRVARRIPVGGTMRRRPDLIRPIDNLEDFGYPSCDRPQVQKLLDTTPGLDRATVEALKILVLAQLDKIRQGAREALHQLSAILTDHLRFRIMANTEILDLQCQVVDRFFVARNCVLERYSHYVRSRRWIENRSTNQRRGCLTHQQNNIMRMWLYRNFKNPYPDEEEKAYIVEETKMNMEQVNNWLINARSRFWKPAMDYFERETLEIKMSVFIRHRLKMTPAERAKAVKAIGSASTHREYGAKRSSS